MIIPVYNVKPYLREAIDSVINQTYHSLEIILIDDGSIDGSEKICDYYQQKDQRIHVIHQNNKGLSGARNAGLDFMHGDIVAFLDPDDAFMPDMISQLVMNMIRTNTDIAACSYYLFYSSKMLALSTNCSVFNLDSRCITADTALRLMLSNKLNINVWNKLYRKRLFDGLRFSEGHVFEDQIITPFLLERANKVTMLSKPLLIHRVKRSGSITATICEQNTRDWLYAMKVKESFILKHTPAVFDMQKAEHFEELFFRDIILHYTRLLSLSDVSMKTKRAFTKEIRMRGQNSCRYSLKARGIYYLYEVNPHLCFYIWLGFGAALKSIRNLRSFHKRAYNCKFIEGLDDYQQMCK